LISAVSSVRWATSRSDFECGNAVSCRSRGGQKPVDKKYASIQYVSFVRAVMSVDTRIEQAPRRHPTVPPQDTKYTHPPVGRRSCAGIYNHAAAFSPRFPMLYACVLVGNAKRSPSNVFPLLCGCHVSPRPLSLSINSGWCLMMTEMLKVWSIGRKSAGKVDQVPPRAPCTEEHAVTVVRYYSEGGA
jgi:hypothetical protein